MDRRPLWPIAVGLTLWVAAGVLAWQDMWWPLIIIAVVSLAPGLAIGGMALLTRRAKRDAGAMLEQSPPPAGPPPRSEPVAEPPTARSTGARTNAKTAGRRRGRSGAAVLVLFAALGFAEGCEKIERARAERRARETTDDGSATAGPSASTPAPKTAPAAATDAALDAALARAITPPTVGEAAWGVDPFVAALVFERIRVGEPPTLSLLEPPPRASGPDQPIPEGPIAGYRVGEVADGSLMHRLGLRTGDVIEAIGGVLLIDPTRIGFALDGAENRVDVTVFRDGMSIVHSYRLTQGLAWKGLLAGFTGAPAVVAVADTTVVPGVPDPATLVPDVPDPTGGSIPPSTPGGGGTKPTPPSGGGSKPTPSPGGAGGSTPPSGSDPVRCESASKCTITKAYFDKMVASPSALQSQATIVPAIQNDVHSGYKLKSVKSGSSVSKLGFRAGDKITHINGRDLTDQMEAAALYLGLSGTSVFKIRFERGGQSQVKTVVVV